MLKKLSAAHDIPLLQLQKIEAVMEKLATTIVNGELLSTHLGITVRSANRILKQLHEKNLAVELPSLTSTTRGRPKNTINSIYISFYIKNCLGKYS